MFWADEIAKKLDINQPQIINDSKTPSGRAHVGALRGVIIHDVMFKVLKEKGFSVRYLYGVDDFDPLDELPYGKDQHFEQYLGRPLCKVPPPPGTNATDMSDFYINEFFDVFKTLGVDVEAYRMRDIYLSGKFDEAIDAILRNAATVREIYKKVSGAERPANWYPFQVICENCGRIGTTEVTDYDGKEVTYTCHPNMVKWATGCGHQGKISPFTGNGKLPWKLEWVAKWKTFGITIEGAGKDHTTKGGSRDVASKCFKAIFNQTAPTNIPYEFFLVGGAKMSSSRGVGASAKDMSNLLPPELLRFLMVRPQPNKPINFLPDEESIVKLFNEFDRYHTKIHEDTNVNDEQRRVYHLSETQPESNYFAVNIQLLQALVQMPHLDVAKEIGDRKGEQLTEADLKHLNQRIDSVKFWLENYASDEERLELQTELPERAQTLTDVQKAFLTFLAEALPQAAWEDSQLQAKIFDVARLTPIKQPLAFLAIYRSLFGRDAGPRAGNLFVFLDKNFLVERFQSFSYDKLEFWRESSTTQEAFAEWLEKKSADILETKTQTNWLENVGVVEFFVTLNDKKTHLHRILFENLAQADFQDQADNYIKQAV